MQTASILVSALIAGCGAAPPPAQPVAPPPSDEATEPTPAATDEASAPAPPRATSAELSAPRSTAGAEPAPAPRAPTPAMPLLHIVTFAKVVAYPDLPSPAPAPAQSGPSNPIPIPDLAGPRKRVAKKIAAAKRKLGKSRGDKRFAAMRELAEHHADKAGLEVDAQAEQRELKHALALYVKCLDPSFAKLPGYDEARFGHASTLMRLGDLKGARASFQELIKNHPTSARVPDVYLALADHYFNSAQIDVAAKLYAKVRAFPNSPLSAYAGYKLAWCHINLADYTRALEHLYKVVVEARRSNTKQAAALARSATSDMVYVYAQVGKPGKAAAFFARVDPSAVADMLEKLGETYSRQGKYAEAITTRRAQMKAAPQSPRMCAWQIDVVDATAAIGKRAVTVRELTRLANIHAQLIASAGPTSAAERACDRAVRTRIGTTARTWHRDARASRDLATAEHAIALYELYLNRFTTSPEAGLNQRYLGELIWQQAASATTPALALPLWQRAAATFTDAATSAQASAATRKVDITAAVLGYDNALAVAAALGREPADLREQARALCEWIAANQPERAADDDVQALRARL